MQETNRISRVQSVAGVLWQTYIIHIIIIIIIIISNSNSSSSSTLLVVVDE